MKVCTLKYLDMYYVKFRILIISRLYDPLRYNVDALNIKLKVISFKYRNKNVKKEESFRKSLFKSLVGSC